jgi:DNA-binding response OmpR family regulator
VTERHRALIVEDHVALAEELAEILRSIECESVLVDNRHDALAALQTSTFCLVLLDLQIKAKPDSIKGHVEQGNALLREMRRMHSDHSGRCHWLPVVIVSGFAREVEAVLEVMKDGANDVIQKPFSSRDVSQTIRQVLERSGRVNHEFCGEKPPPRIPDLGQRIILSIPGHRDRRRSIVRLGARSTTLTDASLKVLLHLMVGFLNGTPVHKTDLGASDDKGFKGISVLREALKGALPEGTDIIANDYNGNYSLTDVVVVGSCDTDGLLELADQKIAALARQLRRHLDAQQQKSDGNI